MKSFNTVFALRDVWMVLWSESQQSWHIGLSSDEVLTNARMYVNGNGTTDFITVSLTKSYEDAVKIIARLEAMRACGGSSHVV